MATVASTVMLVAMTGTVAMTAVMTVADITIVMLTLPAIAKALLLVTLTPAGTVMTGTVVGKWSDIRRPVLGVG